MPSLPGGGELILILLIAILLFGAKKLPDLGRSMGQSITNFKRGINEAKETEPSDEIPAQTARPTVSTAETAQTAPTAETAQTTQPAQTAETRQS